jgi:D-alanyl-D-alanine carboxypeptidase
MSALDDALIDVLRAVPSIPGVVVLARSTDREVVAAAGCAARDRREPLTPSHAFRIASNTKTFVAATAMGLAEQGLVGLDAPIAGVLPGEVSDVLSRRYDLAAITLRMLLQHTSGIASHDTGSHDGTGAPFLAAAKAEPERRWSALDQIAFSVERFAPLFPPGAALAYADTGYVVVGQIIETVSGVALHSAVREHCQLDTLGLRRTFWDRFETPVEPAPRARTYIGDEDWEAVDCSIDLYGGGGLVSTISDLATWWRALFSGKIVGPPALAAMLHPLLASTESHGDAGLGIFRRRLAGRSWWTHSGYWGSVVLHDPEPDLTLVAFRNQAQVRTATIEPILNTAIEATR